MLAVACIMGFAMVAVCTPKAPNIILLMGDDWGFSDVGAFGSEIRTPTIDASPLSTYKQ